MNNFYNMKLPCFIYPYIIGGPTFNTSIIQSISGRESRHPNFASAIWQYTIKNAKLSVDELEQFYQFFLNCKGAAFGFCLKDHADFRAVNQKLEHQEQNSIYQLYKHYHYANYVYKRKIIKPVEGSVKVFINSIPIKAEIDYDSACITINCILDKNQALTTNFEFDVPVRFCNDELKYSFNKDGSVLLEDIKIKELLI